jgi:AcrR family transcriptional regulator
MRALRPGRRANLQIPAGSYHKGGLPDRLLDEAAKAIADTGLDGVSMRKLGARLGVSRTAAYHHFQNKGELLSAVGRRGFARLADRVRTATAGSASTPEAITTMILEYVRFAREETAFFRLMFANVLRRPLQLEGAGELSAFPFSSQEAFDTLNQCVVLIKRGQDEGLLRQGDALLLANTVWAFGHGAANLVIDEHLKMECDPETFVRDGMDLLFKGLRPCQGDDY